MKYTGSLRVKIWVLFTCVMLGWAAAALASFLLQRKIERALPAVYETLPRKMEVMTALERAVLRKDRRIDALLQDPANADLISRLQESRQGFTQTLARVRALTLSPREHEILNAIESKVVRLDVEADQVLGLAAAGQRDAALERYRVHRQQTDDAIRLFEGLHEAAREEARNAGLRLSHEAGVARVLWIAGCGVGAVASIALVALLFSNVLVPLRKLVREAGPEAAEVPGTEDIDVLGRRVRELMKDVDETHTELKLSREHLIQSGKLAMVGKLAAGVAHSIRNPLTSVKMRLFSMERSLDLAATEREDFEVISEEIKHIDTIVQNFLEFSRPPKLKIQPVSPSDVVDMAIQLLKHRVESYNVSVELYRQQRLSDIDGDPEQLKEVLVNLVMNACEAMGNGGEILIHEEEGTLEPQGRVVVIQVTDNGPGIPEPIRERIFQPFYTTREEGTGLGLSIAARIIEEHRGWLNCRSKPGRTTFTITLPCREDRAWLRS